MWHNALIVPSVLIVVAVAFGVYAAGPPVVSAFKRFCTDALIEVVLCLGIVAVGVLWVVVLWGIR